MKIKDIFQQRDSLLDKEVTIEAVLIVDGGSNFLTSDSGSKAADQNTILIEQGDLEDKLLEEVPCYVGGDLYNDDVLVTGKLIKSRNGLSPLSLTDVKKMIVKREDETYSVSF